MQKSGSPTTGVAVVGCGFAADLYLYTMPNHPELSVVGVFDIDHDRMESFASHHQLPCYPDLDAVLADERVDLVVNLTSPASHYDVTRRALQADKHVYSEKPLATSHRAADELVQLAEQRGLTLGAAPCNLLGENIQTLWSAVRNGTIGRPLLAFAELNDGPIHQMPYWDWRSPSGAAWPYRNEFQTGCTLEHAGYQLTCLIAMFGAITEVSALATTVVTEVPGVADPAPDVSSASLYHSSGVVSRLTCSIVAPRDRSLQIVGDEGTLITPDIWDFGAPVFLRRSTSQGPEHLTEPEPYPLVRACEVQHHTGPNRLDFARGVAELAQAVAEQRPPRPSARHALHVLDVTMSIANGESRKLDSDTEPVEPMPWAEPRRDSCPPPALASGDRLVAAIRPIAVAVP